MFLTVSWQVVDGRQSKVADSVEDEVTARVGRRERGRSVQLVDRRRQAPTYRRSQPPVTDRRRQQTHRQSIVVPQWTESAAGTRRRAGTAERRRRVGLHAAQVETTFVSRHQ